MKRARPESGFTLLELVVVIGIIGVVSGIGVMTFGNMMSEWGGLRSRIDLDRKADNVLQSIRKDIDAIISPSLAPDSLVLFSMDGSSTLIMPVSIQSMNAGALMGEVANYSVEEGNLRRGTFKLGVEFDPGEFPVKVAEGVAEFFVEVDGGDGIGWVDMWEGSEQGLPRAVRISVTLEDPDNPTRDQVTRRAVFPIHVK